jgi:methyltransferase family protein
LHEMPSNHSFVQVNMLKGLPFPDKYFDFVHQRLLFLSIPTALWPQVLRELVRVTNVGGWLELVETRTSGQNIGPYTTQAVEWINEASRRLGIDPTLVPNLGDDLRQAGLIQVQSYSVPIPVGRWAGRIGTMMASNMVAIQQTLKALIVAQLGINPLKFDQYLTAQQQEWEDLHSNIVFDFVYGQRGI